MKVQQSNTSFDQAVNDLVDFLQIEFQKGSCVSVPDRVIDPFRKITAPEDAEPPERFCALFQNKHCFDPIQISPPSFYAIFAIILALPCSRAKMELVGRFINVILAYKDGLETQKIIFRLTGTQIELREIAAAQNYICRKVSKLVVGILSQLSEGLQKRILAAQILVHLFSKNEQTSEIFQEPQVLSSLRNVIYQDSDYLLRIMVAYQIKIVVQSNIQALETWPAKAASLGLSELPIGTKANGDWVAQAVNFLRTMDSSRPLSISNCEYRVFTVSKLQINGLFRQDTHFNVAVFVSDDFHILILHETAPHLQAVELISSKSMLQAYPVRIVGVNGREVIISVTRDHYVQFMCDYTRLDVVTILAFFAKKEMANEFVAAVDNASARRHNNEAIYELLKNTKPSVSYPRHSVMFMDMTWSSDDNESSEFAHSGKAEYLDSPLKFRKSPYLNSEAVEGVQDVFEGRHASNPGEHYLQPQRRSKISSHDVISLQKHSGLQTQLYQKLQISQAGHRDLVELMVQTPLTNSDSTSNCSPNLVSSPCYKLSQQQVAASEGLGSLGTTTRIESNLEGLDLAPFKQTSVQRNAAEAIRAGPHTIIEANEKVKATPNGDTTASYWKPLELEENQNNCDRNFDEGSGGLENSALLMEQMKPVEHFVNSEATQNNDSSFAYEGFKEAVNAKIVRDSQNVVDGCVLKKINNYTSSTIASDQFTRTLMFPIADDRVYANENPAGIIGEVGAVDQLQNLRQQATKSNLGQSTSKQKISEQQDSLTRKKSNTLKPENNQKTNDQNATSISPTRAHAGNSYSNISSHKTLNVACQHDTDAKGDDDDCNGNSNIEAPIEIEQSLNRPNTPANQVCEKDTGSKSKRRISETTSINYFASRLTQMLLPEITTPRMTHDFRKTTFGDRRQFVANVNAARNFPPHKQTSPVNTDTLKLAKGRKRLKPPAKSRNDGRKLKQYQAPRMRKAQTPARFEAMVQASNKPVTRKSTKGGRPDGLRGSNKQHNLQKSRVGARPEVNTAEQNNESIAQHLSEEHQVRIPLHHDSGTTLRKPNMNGMSSVNQGVHRQTGLALAGMAVQKHVDDTQLQTASDKYVQIASRTKEFTEVGQLLSSGIPNEPHDNAQQFDELSNKTTSTTQKFRISPYTEKTACFDNPNPQKVPLIHFGPKGPENQGIPSFLPQGSRSPAICGYSINAGDFGDDIIIQDTASFSSSPDHSTQLIGISKSGNGYNRIVDGAETKDVARTPVTTSVVSVVGGTDRVREASVRVLASIAPTTPISNARISATLDKCQDNHLLGGSEHEIQSSKINTLEYLDLQLKQAPEPHEKRVHSTTARSSRSKSPPKKAVSAPTLQANQQSKQLQLSPEPTGPKAGLQSVQPYYQETGYGNFQNQLTTSCANVGYSTSRGMTRTNLGRSHILQPASGSVASLPHMVGGKQSEPKFTLKGGYHGPIDLTTLPDRNRISRKRKSAPVEEPACSEIKQSRQCFDTQIPAFKLPQQQHDEAIANPGRGKFEPSGCKIIPKRLRPNEISPSTKRSFHENLVASTPDNFTKLLNKSTRKYRFEEHTLLNRIGKRVLGNVANPEKDNQHLMDIKSTHWKQIIPHRLTHIVCDLSTDSEPDLGDAPALKNLHSSTSCTKVSPMRYKLQNSINETLNTVLFHITANENQLKANVTAIHNGGQILLEKFRETFTNQANHKTQKLKSCIQEEITVLNNSLELLRQPGSNTTAFANGTNGLNNIYTNRHRLISQLDNTFDK